ncbi:MAG: tyrosine-type recombinase/integrase [Hyalangium sp.]|uniref:tyrosine-type recombinase/integrase n=1 Tax=Hyalangium sp. TaxID=2028555 RepID=UPI00389A54F4
MSVPLSPLLQRFESHLACARWLSPHTVRNYLVDARHLEAWLGARGQSLKAATRADLKSYFVELRPLLAPASRARRLEGVKELYRFLQRHRMVKASPAERLGERFGRARRRPSTWLSEAEVASVLARPVAPTVFLLRDRAILELLYGGGLRSAELQGLNLDDVDVAGCMVRVMGKGMKERLCPLNRDAMRALQEYLELRPLICRGGDEDAQRAVFLNSHGERACKSVVYRCVQRAFASRLGKHVSPHALRHAFASHLVHRGARITDVQELLGHADANTTARYVQCTTEYLQAQHQAHHPRA